MRGQIVPFQKVNFEASKLSLAPIKEGVGGRLSLSKSSIFEISFSFYKKGGRRFLRPYYSSLPRGSIASSLSNFHLDAICDPQVILSPDVKN